MRANSCVVRELMSWLFVCECRRSGVLAEEKRDEKAAEKHHLIAEQAKERAAKV